MLPRFNPNRKLTDATLRAIHTVLQQVIDVAIRINGTLKDWRAVVGRIDVLSTRTNEIAEDAIAPLESLVFGIGLDYTVKPEIGARTIGLTRSQHAAHFKVTEDKLRHGSVSIECTTGLHSRRRELRHQRPCTSVNITNSGIVALRQGDSAKRNSAAVRWAFV